MEDEVLVDAQHQGLFSGKPVSPSQSATDVAIGFSRKTCRPASSSRRAIASCASAGPARAPLGDAGRDQRFDIRENMGNAPLRRPGLRQFQIAIDDRRDLASGTPALSPRYARLEIKPAPIRAVRKTRHRFPWSKVRII